MGKKSIDLLDFLSKLIREEKEKEIVNLLGMLKKLAKEKAISSTWGPL